MNRIARYLKLAKINTADEFMKALEPKLKQIFPKSNVIVRLNKSFGTDIEVFFTVGKGPKEFPHQIEHNDPLRMVFMIGDGQIDKDGQLATKITAELASGGKMTWNNRGSSVDLKYRKKTDAPEKIIDHLIVFFKKVRNEFDKHKPEMPEYLHNK